MSDADRFHPFKPDWLVCPTCREFGEDECVVHRDQEEREQIDLRVPDAVPEEWLS